MLLLLLLLFDTLFCDDALLLLLVALALRRNPGESRRCCTALIGVGGWDDGCCCCDDDDNDDDNDEADDCCWWWALRLLFIALYCSRDLACDCCIWESLSLGFCKSVTRFAWIWKQSEKSLRKVIKSLGVLNIRNHCSCGKLVVTKWNSWSTIMGPFISMHWAKKSNICWVPRVSMLVWGKCSRSRAGKSAISSQPTKTTWSSTTWKVSVCLERNSVNSLICWPTKWKKKQLVPKFNFQ